MKIKKSAGPSFCNMHPLNEEQLRNSVTRTLYTKPSGSLLIMASSRAGVHVQHIQRFENMTNIHDQALVWKGVWNSLLINPSCH